MVIVLENIYKTAIWGGNNLRKLFSINSPFEITSEIWTASAHKNGPTPIKNKQDFSCETLEELYREDKAKGLFGSNCLKYDSFPLLAKWIDANGKLSVQVHPDDEYAKVNHDSFGKTEAWYIVSAKPDAQIVYGLKEGTKKEDLEKAIAENRIEEVLNFVPVKEGEIYYIPSGTVHALLDGVVVYEIQQSSDITYRLYDWNRVDKDGKPRQLHINQALDVIDFESASNVEAEQLVDKSYCYFGIKRYSVNGEKDIEVNPDSFKLCSVLNGEVTLRDKSKEYSLKAGESFILLSKNSDKEAYNLSGEAIILESKCN